MLFNHYQLTSIKLGSVWTAFFFMTSLSRSCDMDDDMDTPDKQNSGDGSQYTQCYGQLHLLASSLHHTD